MTDTNIVPDSVLHDAPCLLSIRGNWYHFGGDVWLSNWECTCVPTAAAPEPEASVDPEPVVHLRNLVAAGGWASPAGLGYGLEIPEVTVRRGGLQFSTPKPLSAWISSARWSVCARRRVRSARRSVTSSGRTGACAARSRG